MNDAPTQPVAADDYPSLDLQIAVARKQAAINILNAITRDGGANPEKVGILANAYTHLMDQA